MRFYLFVGAMGLLLSNGAAAEAADPSTLGCVGLAVGPGVMQTLGEGAMRNNEGRPGPSVERELQQLSQAADQCRRRYGWSKQAAMTAALWTLTSARIDAAAAALRNDGVDPTKVGEAMGRLSRAEFAGLARQPISQSSVVALGQHCRDLGLPTEGLIGHRMVFFAAMLAGEEPTRMRFAAE